MRLDQWLVKHNHYASRHKAQAEIRAGRVNVNGERVKKPSYLVTSHDRVECATPLNPYVGRGGLKLEHALDTFNIDVSNKTVIDIGSSTGGFTDCLLKRGANHVTCVDVGRDQLAEELALNTKTTVYEATNFLNTDATLFPKIDFAVIDLSFTAVMPHLIHLYTFYQGFTIVLFKPQFETGKAVPKGVIRNPKQHIRLLKNFVTKLRSENLFLHALTPSPIEGQRGNREFLCLIGDTPSSNTIDIESIVTISMN